jgi:CRISPR-associated endonuclease/helicase Cas3
MPELEKFERGEGMFWGKYDDLASPCVHPLADHCLDVATVFRRLAVTPRIHQALQYTARSSLTSERQLTRLAAIAYLHDIGKCNWGFQAKRKAGARETAGHVLEAVALLRDEAVYAQWPEAWRRTLASMALWFDEGDTALLEMLLAAISHHGRPVSDNDYANWSDRRPARWWEPRNGVDPMHGLAELADAVQAAFPDAFVVDDVTLDATPALQQRFAGLVMLADWIGSDTRFFPYRTSDDEVRKPLAEHAAERALRIIGIEALQQDRTAAGFTDVFGFEPSPLQAQLAGLLPCDDASRLVLVESDTGSGKTEAALAWFLRLYSQGAVEGLYFALPTRVAARELYGRVFQAIDRAFPDLESRPGPVLLAASGYVRVDGEALTLPDPSGTLWDDDAAAARRERLWAAERPKRFLAAPVAVGTVDQALLSTLKVKHALLRSVCLDRSLLVVDEVHASDSYMREVLRALLRGHIARGGWALLLSATLGDSARAMYFDTVPRSLDVAVARPYPAITTLRAEVPVAPTGRRKDVTIEFDPSLDEASLLPRVCDALAHGARILVVCNTVARANALLRAVENSGRVEPHTLFRIGDAVCPHHGRFAREDREAMDLAVSARLGKGSASGPVLLIGTQTLEQSLDIDADWLITDLCPMDVLLQRIGRLHRHARPQRPEAFATARLLLRVPDGGDLARYVDRLGACHGPTGTGIGRVYVDGRVLQRTLEILRAQPRVTLPDDNRRLVEAATHPESLAGLEDEAWLRHGAWLEGGLLARVREALSSTLDDAAAFGELQYRAPEVSVTTRLGARDLSLPLSSPMVSPLGNRLTRLHVPGHMVTADAPIPDTLDAEATAEGLAFVLDGRRYRYTRFGLEFDDA